MPIRWIICPIVRDGEARKSKVSVLTDPGRLPKTELDDLGNLVTVQPTYQHTSIISDGIGRPGEADDWCLSLVFGADLTTLTLDAEITDVLEEDFVSLASMRSGLALTPQARGWGAAKTIRVRDRLAARGADVSNLVRENPAVFDWLDRLALAVHTHHVGVRTLHVTERT